MRILHKKNILVLILTLSVTFSAQAQPPGLAFKRLFMDYQTFNGGDFSAFRKYTGGLEIAFIKPITDNVMINVPVKIGMFSNDEVTNTSVIGLDLQLNYYPLAQEYRLSPYLLVGAGAVLENKDSVHAQFPVGFGLDLRLFPSAYLSWQSEVRFATADDRNNLHHSIGFKYFFKRAEEEIIPEIPVPVPDADQDGVPDADDACPTQPGLAALQGCPDTDGDGIRDSEDDCPEYPGLREFNGCPDSDGDGVPDTDDECPSVPGVRENNGCPLAEDRDQDGVADNVDRCPDEPGTLNGCPDTDGDGIADIDDRCPTIKGLAVFQGCPDTDGDGLDDLVDRCPNMAGPVENGGCPPIEEEDKETLDVAMRAVQFEHGSARLKPESNRILNQVYDILQRYPDYRLEINGHTDNTGSDEFNRQLSQDRARACYEYLVARGISVRRMSYVGFGESRPIADNNTLTGRQLNRRVEFNLLPGRN